MKRFTFFLSILTIGLLFALTGCEGDGLCKKGTGDTIEQSFDFSTIDGVHVKGAAEVTLTQGAKQEVIVQTQRNVMDALDFRVVNGILVIDLDGCWNNYDMNVDIIMTEPLTELSVSGASTITAQGQFEAADELDLDISGAGEIKLQTLAKRIDTRISGSGKINLSGEATTHEVTISGSGDLNAYEMITTDYEINVSGSGLAQIFVGGGVLDVNITGSGDIYYKGNPSSINSKITGSGQLIDSN